VKFNSICVIGLGYIGLPTASTFATSGIRVMGIDINEQIVAGLQNGQLHLYEPGLRTLVQAALRSGNLTIHHEPMPADAFIIAVPTPFKENKKADMSFVEADTHSILPHLQKGNLVVLESTSPPRTTVDLVAPILEQKRLKAGTDFSLAYSPERVLPGQILRELIENTRIIGGINRESAEAGRDLYATFVRGEILLTDATTAEMVKLMENTSRDVNIALANEFSHLAEFYGVDVWEAIQLANRHPRVKILNPGPGVGGHCISVDPWFLVEAAPKITPLIRTAREVNDSQPSHVVELCRQYLGDLKGRHITALGLAYKADVDDLRESPAIHVCEILHQAGAKVTAYEPFKNGFRHQSMQIAGSLTHAVKESEALLLLTAHEEFRTLVPAEVAKLTKARIAIDCTGAWEREKWESTGFRYFRIGVGKESQINQNVKN
jgi:UDP-N-acetyl-D-mannosaminuronic acid dehydrogenase